MRSIGKTRWLALALPLAAVAMAAQQRLYFIDEAKLDASFVEFRTQLRKAVAEHDAAFVRSVLYPGIELSAADEEQGPEEFERLWNPDDPKTQLWTELGDLLALGGSFLDERHQFCAPYVYSNWPKGLDREEKVALVAPEVPVHATCEVKSPVIAILGYDLVTELEPNGATTPAAGPTRSATPEGWTRIEFAEGKKGCVRDDYVRSPLDYHACFEKIQGKWMMTALMSEE